jgi:hypothetical protein
MTAVTATIQLSSHAAMQPRRLQGGMLPLSLPKISICHFPANLPLPDFRHVD